MKLFGTGLMYYTLCEERDGENARQISRHYTYVAAETEARIQLRLNSHKTFVISRVKSMARISARPATITVVTLP